MPEILTWWVFRCFAKLVYFTLVILLCFMLHSSACPFISIGLWAIQQPSILVLRMITEPNGYCEKIVDQMNTLVGVLAFFLGSALQFTTGLGIMVRLFVPRRGPLVVGSTENILQQALADQLCSRVSKQYDREVIVTCINIYLTMFRGLFRC